MDLSLNNVITISVAAPGAGIGNFNTSNLAIFTREAFQPSFGTAGYNQYLDPAQVGIDFGTNSNTFKMANAIFSQQPNILAGDGQLVIIPFASTPAVTAVQSLTFPSVPTTGSYVLKYGSQLTASIAAAASAATIQSDLRALTGLGSVVVAAITGGFSITFTGVSGPVANLQVVQNSLQDGSGFDVVPVVATTTAGTVLSTETLDAAITRTEGLVQYFGLMAAEIASQADVLAAAAVIQPLNKIGFFVSRSSADINPGGTLDLLRSGSFSQSRGLYYGSADDTSALVMMASYAGRALSTDFTGSNTTQTMHLKDLIGVQPDPSMTQTLLNDAQAAGADVYASIQGVPKVFTSGANLFFDQIYNRRAFVGQLAVNGFNALAEVSNKIPQTEAGMDVLKGVYRQACDQYVGNQYIAPGSWTSPSTFGNLADFLRNIQDVGYYIFSQPVSQQNQADRVARKAPLIQIAIKEAGAIHKSNVIVNINF